MSNDIHEHITLNDMIRVATIDTDALEYDDIDFLDEIDEKIESCESCHKKYTFFWETQSMFGLLRSSVNKKTVGIVERIDEILSSLEEGIRTKVEQWLDGAQDFLGSLQPLSLQPAGAGAMRGITKDSSENAEIVITTTIGEDGLFAFELLQDTTLTIKVNKENGYGQPVCLIVTGQGDNDFFAIYPLTGFTFGGFESNMLSCGDISLSAGAYMICVPTIKDE